MENIMVNRYELLNVIKKNRENHRGDFLKAQDGYKKKVIEVLEERLKDAREGKQFETYVALPVPRDFTKDYDRIIKMIEMSVGETIEISQTEFARYVMDDWDWKNAWSTTNSLYMMSK